MFTKQQIELVQRVAKNMNLPFDQDEAGDFPSLFIYNHDVALLEDGTYLVSETKVIPGVRYTANGDGWPDSAEPTELETFTTFKEAVMFMAQRLAAAMVEFALIDLADEDMDRQNLEAAITGLEFPKLPE